MTRHYAKYEYTKDCTVFCCSLFENGKRVGTIEIEVEDGVMIDFRARAHFRSGIQLAVSSVDVQHELWKFVSLLDAYLKGYTKSIEFFASEDLFF